MSSERKAKRRDKDPVRVYPDGRLAFWTGGLPGVGARVMERHGCRERAEDRAVELRKRLALTQIAGPEAGVTLDRAMQDMVISMRKGKADNATIRQYLSNWNCWVPEEVGAKVRCLDVEIRHFTAIFDHAVAGGASPSTVKNLARTLGAFTTWAVDHGYFISGDSFGDRLRRQSIVRRARKRAKVNGATQKKRYTLKVCPTPTDVTTYAEAFELEYPGYGRRLVLLAFATGLRINELLALRHDSIDLTTGEVDVAWQLDRDAAWPAVKLPKGRKVRTAIVWGYYLDMAQTLVEDSLAMPENDPHHGWLFPRHRSTTRWADQAGKLAGAAKAACDWNWTFHWLRHAFATYSLAPKGSGGFGLDLPSVQHWLGHAQPSITQDMYVERRAGDVGDALKLTATAPGGA